MSKRSKRSNNNKNSNIIANDDNNDKNSNNNCNSDPLISCFFSLSSKQFTILSALIGILLTDNLDLSQQNSLGNFIVNVGQAMLTVAAQGQLLQNGKNHNNGLNTNGPQDNNTKQEIERLQQQICALEHKLDNLNKSVYSPFEGNNRL